MKHRELTQKIIDAARTVHITLGPGLGRDVYRKALVVELDIIGMKFDTDREAPIAYRDVVVGSSVLELVVEDVVALHVCEDPEISSVAYTRLRAQMAAAEIDLGMIVGFGSQRVDVRRVEFAPNDHVPSGNHFPASSRGHIS